MFQTAEVDNINEKEGAILYRRDISLLARILFVKVKSELKRIFLGEIAFSTHCVPVSF